ncbi:MAG: hypothetical protein NTW25_00445 [Candidatus Kapabacteria bacterium]|nr:hypothetical protein [Candidatus Kapabacteria bacterium]
MIDFNVSLLNNIYGIGALCLSKSTNDFLYNVANKVQSFNMNLVNEIRSKGTMNGSSSGSFKNDLSILFKEQTVVQDIIDKLENKNEVISDYNKAFGLFQRLSIAPEYLKIAIQANDDQDLNFGNLRDRLLIGSAGLRIGRNEDTSPAIIKKEVDDLLKSKGN